MACRAAWRWVMDGLSDGIVIVGGGIAGDSCASELRRRGYSGRLTMIGEEPWRPYERPPLSKAALREPESIPASFFLKSDTWYRDNGVELILGERVLGLDLASKRLITDAQQAVPFGQLLLATGGDVRRLGIAGASEAVNVSYLRTKDDAIRLAHQLSAGVRLVVIGMGVIGSEIAATARQLGCQVHAIEPEATPMARALGSDIGRWLAAVHEERGVRVSYGRALRRFVMDGDRVGAVECDDGSLLECDAVCVGIGIIPRSELAAQAALTVNNGIVVNASNRTICDFVFAAGDVARVPAAEGRTVRYETYQNSADQGVTAARAMLGDTTPRAMPCTFWTDQYEYNIQIVGTVADGLVQARRPLSGGGFAQIYLSDGVIAGCVAVNAGRDLPVLRRMVVSAIPADPAALACPDVALRDILGRPG